MSVALGNHLPGHEARNSAVAFMEAMAERFTPSGYVILGARSQNYLGLRDNARARDIKSADEAEIEQMRRYYEEAGWSAERIGALHGFNPVTVGKLLRRAGVAMRVGNQKREVRRG